MDEPKDWADYGLIGLLIIALWMVFALLGCVVLSAVIDDWLYVWTPFAAVALGGAIKLSLGIFHIIARETAFCEVDFEARLWESLHKDKVGRAILVQPEGYGRLPFDVDPDWAVKGKIIGLQTEPALAFVVQFEGHEEQVTLAEQMVHLLPPPDTQPDWTAYCFGYVPERIEYSKN